MPKGTHQSSAHGEEPRMGSWESSSWIDGKPGERLQEALNRVLRSHRLMVETRSDRFGEAAPRTFLDLAGAAISSMADAIRDYDSPPIDPTASLAVGLAYGLAAFEALNHDMGQPMRAARQLAPGFRDGAGSCPG